MVMTKVGNVWMNLRPMQIKCLEDLQKAGFKPAREPMPDLVIMDEFHYFERRVPRGHHRYWMQQGRKLAARDYQPVAGSEEEAL